MTVLLAPYLFLLVLTLLHESNAFFVGDSSSRVGDSSSRLYKRKAQKPHFRSSLFGTSDVEPSEKFQVSIEYCTACQWGLRSFWTAQELLSTFQDDVALAAVTLIPSHQDGQFVIQCHGATQSNILWDRKERDGFPEMKQLKQLVRDQINPTRFLGHSDFVDRQEEKDPNTKPTVPTVLSLDGEAEPRLDPKDALPELCNIVEPNVAIAYCTGCRWLLRAAYVGQELMATFDEEIHSFTLIPSRPPVKGGAFLVLLNDSIVYDRTQEGRFPEIQGLKQLLRDRLNTFKTQMENMDDDEAAEARKFFGVL